MKKYIIFLLLLACAFNSNAQTVFADPAIGTMSLLKLNNEPQDPFLIPLSGIFILKVPIRNNNLTNSIPLGTSKVKINLGSKLVLDPSFTISTANTNQYFNWTASVISGNVQIEGNLIAAIPNNFSDTAIFRLKGAVLGPAIVTTNYLVTNHNSGSFVLSDANGNNNGASLAYEVVDALPVTFVSFTARKQQCFVELIFNTANEVNVNRFEIEVSTDGIRFNKIGALAAGNFGSYSFKFDITANLQSTNLFTRIKSVDFDEQFQYSEVNKVNGLCGNDKNTILIFPNPAPDHSTFITIRNDTGLFNGNYVLLLLDINGRLISKKKIILFNEKQFNYQHGFLPTGDYVVQMFTENGGQAYNSIWQKQ